MFFITRTYLATKLFPPEQELRGLGLLVLPTRGDDLPTCEWDLHVLGTGNRARVALATITSMGSCEGGGTYFDRDWDRSTPLFIHMAENHVELVLSSELPGATLPLFLCDNPDLVPCTYQVRVRLNVGRIKELPDFPASLAYMAQFEEEMAKARAAESLYDWGQPPLYWKELAQQGAEQKIEAGLHLPIAVGDPSQGVLGALHLDQHLENRDFLGTLFLMDERAEIQNGTALRRRVE